MLTALHFSEYSKNFKLYILVLLIKLFLFFIILLPDPGDYTIMKGDIVMKRKRRVVVLSFVLSLFCLCGVAYAYNTQSTTKVEWVTLADNTSTQIYERAYCKAGLSWWDTCEADFYFIEEHRNFNGTAPSTVDAILDTFPVCKTYKVNGNKCIDTMTFTTDDGEREYSFHDGWCNRAYGTKLEVKIAAPNGYRYYYTYDYY